MSDRGHSSAIEFWLADVRTHLADVAPRLLSLYDVYAAEAIFGRRYIASDLDCLEPGARVLEIGAGALLLSCQLVREGFQVTGVEPTGIGFSHFEQLRQRVLERAVAQRCLPKLLDMAAEALVESSCYDYAFSVNVMEHVNDVTRTLANVERSLTVGASYRFTCPNYLFPYEPHFNIPTVFSKELTEKLLGRKIFGCRRMSDPLETWQSLNWINCIQVKKIVRQLPGTRVIFNRGFLVTTLERIARDPEFAGRRSPTIRKMLLLLVRLRMHQLLRFMPAMLQPVMDCRLQKTADSLVC